MSALHQHSVWSGYLSGTDGTPALGSVVIPASARYVVVATEANRTTFNRLTAVAGIVIREGDNSTVEVQTVGPCPPAITGLGAGTAMDLRVSTTGTLERAVIGAGDIYCGRCDEDGWAYLNFAAAAVASTGATPAGNVGDVQVKAGPTTLGAVPGNDVDDVLQFDGAVWSSKPGVQVPDGSLNDVVGLDGAGQLKNLGPMTSGGEVNTASNVGAGEDVFKVKSGVDLQFKTLVAGTNITLTPGTDDLTIDAAGGGGGGTVTSASNVGTGEGVFKTLSGSDLEFHKLLGAGGIVASLVGDDIQIDGSGITGSGVIANDKNVIYSDGTNNPVGDGAFLFDKASKQVSTTGPMQAGYFYPQTGTPAASGLLRAAIATTAVAARNVGGSADIALVTTNALNDQFFGDDTNARNWFGTTPSSGSHHLWDGSNFRLILSSSLMSCCLPLAGSIPDAVPLRLKSTSVAISSGSFSPADLTIPIVVLTGTTLISPGHLQLANVADAVYWVLNQTAANIDVRHVGSSSTAIQINAGKTGMFWHNGTDYLPLGIPNGGV